MNIYRKKHHPKSVQSFAPPSLPPAGLKPIKGAVKTTPLNTLRNLPQPQGGPTPPNLFHLALSKMAYGATPEDIAHIQSMPGATDVQKLNAYIDEQLDPATINDAAADALLQPANGFNTLNKTRTQLFQEHIWRPDGSDIPWEYHIRPHHEIHNATFIRGIHSKRQLLEVMADFWHNHFNVYVDHDSLPGMFVNYDRDVIRANAFGNIRQLLLDVTQSYCMLRYLGNAYNEESAPNENYARELLELHTISAENYFGHMPWQDVPVDGQGRRVGYVEEDVLELARALTGWSYNGAHWGELTDPGNPNHPATGEFYFRNNRHDTGSKRVMGQTFNYNAGQPMQDFEQILDMLAEHPATAQFIAKKLCRRFISDNPSQSIVDQVADALHQNWQAADQIKLGMEVLLKSSEFRSTWGEKIKRPLERTISALRLMQFNFTFNPDHDYTGWFYWAFLSSGQSPFHWSSPNGYPDMKGDWLGASSTMQTWRYVQLLGRLRDGDNGDAPLNDILSETLANFTNPNDITANSLVDYWFNRACGRSADAFTHDRLAGFMSYNFISNVLTETDHDAVIALSGGGANDWPNYNVERLTAMVSLIAMTTDFNYR